MSNLSLQKIVLLLKQAGNISLSRQVSHYSTHRHMNSNNSIFQLIPDK